MSLINRSYIYALCERIGIQIHNQGKFWIRDLMMSVSKNFQVQIIGAIQVDEKGIIYFTFENALAKFMKVVLKLCDEGF